MFLADSQLQPEVMALVQEVPHLRAEVVLFRAEGAYARLRQLLAAGDAGAAVEQATYALNMNSWFTYDAVPATRWASLYDKRAQAYLKL